MMSSHDKFVGDDDGGFEGPDVETSVHEQPVIEPKGNQELDDSADSYVSPARTRDQEDHGDD